MTYSKQNWSNGEIGNTPLNAGRLNHMEDGIEDAHQDLADHISDSTDAHDASSISVVPTGGVSASNVQLALVELDTEKATVESVSGVSAQLTAHLNDGVDAHDASAISFNPTGNISANTVQAALAELDSEKLSSSTVSSIQADLNNHITDTTAAHAASAISFTPAGTVAATTVQAAIVELDTEKATTTSVASVNAALINHITDTTAAHAASAISFTPVGSISGNTVQAAVTEVDGDLTAHLNDTVDAHDASAISLLDTGNLYTATNVETALAEVATKVNERMKTGVKAVGSSITSLGAITSVVDVPGLTVTWTAESTRLYRVAWKLLVIGGGANDLAVLYLTDGSNGQVDRVLIHIPPLISGSGYMTVHGEHYVTGLTGSVTRKLRIERNVGSGGLTAYASASEPAWLVVEDVTTA